MDEDLWLHDKIWSTHGCDGIVHHVLLSDLKTQQTRAVNDSIWRILELLTGGTAEVLP